MTLQVTGTALEKVETYLFRLGVTMANLPPGERDENVREIRAHILDSVTAAGGSVDEAVDAVLARLGTAEGLAFRFERESSLARASRSSSPLIWLRTTARWALTGVEGFTAFLIALFGYSIGVGFLLAGLLKPFFPTVVGLFLSNHGLTLNRQGVVGERDLLGAYFLPFALSMGGGFVICTTLLLKLLVRFCGRAKRGLSQKPFGV